MKKNNFKYDILEQEIEKKERQKEKRKRKRIKVSGKSVFGLQEIIKKRAEK